MIRPHCLLTALVLLSTSPASAHGTVVSPISRVYRVYQSNPSNPSFALAQQAVAIDGELSYYTWNEVSRTIPAAVSAGLPPGFDYSPWLPDGAIASGGRIDPSSSEYPRTYAGLDQVSTEWPTTPVTAGAMLPVDFLATATHQPSVWDVWMTSATWTPNQPLTWAQMEHLGRPQVTLSGGHYLFDVAVPADRDGHHVLWVTWQRDDPAGEVFFSASDILVFDPTLGTNYCGPAIANSTGSSASIAALGSSTISDSDFSLVAGELPQQSSGYFLVSPSRATIQQPGGSIGVLCLGAPQGRFVQQVVHSGASGSVSIDVDLTTLPRPTGPIAVQPGQTWGFQLWYRDTIGGVATSNFTDAVEVTFD